MGGPFQLPETILYTTDSPQEISSSSHFRRSGSIRAERCATANSGPGGADDTGGVKLEWLENHVVLPSEDHVTSQVQGASAALGPDAQPAEVPYQPEASSVNSESCQFPVRPRRERKGAMVAPELCWNSCCLPCVAFTLAGSLLVNC